MGFEEYRWKYLVGIDIHDIYHKDAGKPFLDFFIELDQEWAREQMMEDIVQNTSDEPHTVKKPITEKLNGAYRFATLRARANHRMLTCVFHSNSRWTREMMELHVKHTPLEELKKARINI